MLKATNIYHFFEPLDITCYKTQEDIQAMEEKISSLQKEKEEVEQTNYLLLTHSFELRARVECAERDLAKSNAKLSTLEVAKLKAKVDKLDTKKEIKDLKVEVAHIEDSRANSFEEIFKNIME